MRWTDAGVATSITTKASRDLGVRKILQVIEGPYRHRTFRQLIQRGHQLLDGLRTQKGALGARCLARTAVQIVVVGLVLRAPCRQAALPIAQKVRRRPEKVGLGLIDRLDLASAGEAQEDLLNQVLDVGLPSDALLEKAHERGAELARQALDERRLVYWRDAGCAVAFRRTRHRGTAADWASERNDLYLLKT